jgi:hypothetical protein
MIDPVLLQQFCDPGMSFADYMSDFQFFKAIGCVFIGPLGFYVTGLMVYGAVALPLYIRQNSTIIPVTLLFLVGGAILPQVAGPGVALAALAVLLTGAGVLTVLYYRYS